MTPPPSGVPRPDSGPDAQGTVYRSTNAGRRDEPAGRPARGASRRTARGASRRTARRPARSAGQARRSGRARRYGWTAAVVAALLITTTAAVVGRQMVTRARIAATADGGTAAGEPGLSGAGTPDVAAPEVPSATPTRPAPATQPAAPLLAPHPVTVTVDGSYSWALLNRRDGTVSGSLNDTTYTSTTESMIKGWIASDYLRRQAAAGMTPDEERLEELTTMIEDSDDAAAEDIYRYGGGNDVIDRAISTCGLTGTNLVDGWWSETTVTAVDATRLGLCIADGRAAGPTWTAWILARMRQVRGEGRFGVVTALPPGVAATTAIKNGWTLVDADGDWHVNCLAIQTDWILAVLTRYDGSYGLSYGANICASVTRQLMAASG